MCARKAVGVLIVGASAALALASPPGPSFQGLGYLPGAVGSSARGISDDAVVVVGTCIVDPTQNEYEAFRWTADGGMVGLGDLPGGIFQSHGRTASADGSVVVGFSVSARSMPRFEGFRCVWGPGGAVMEGLGDFSGGAFGSVALDVSADGSVVVGQGWTALGLEGFRWKDLNGNGRVDPDEELAQHPEFALGDLPGGGYYSEAVGVSADGSVLVGMSQSTESGSDDYEAYRWEDLNGNGEVDPNETLDFHPEFGLGDLPGGEFHSFAGAVSPDGSVVVGGSVSASGWEAFRWTAVTGMQGLGTLPGYDESTAHGVSADGSVIVGYCTVPTDWEAFVWDADNGMRSIRDVLMNHFGLDLTDWDLIKAAAVSPDGRTIVGEGVNPVGWLEAWIAIFPCPGDLDADNDIDLADLAQLLANYGATSGAIYGDGDLDGDGDVDLADLAALLAVYGTSCG